MRIFDLHSKRNAKPCEKMILDQISYEVRLQIKFIIDDFFKSNGIESYCEEHIWPEIQAILKREHKKKDLYREGLHSVFGGYIASSEEVKNYLINEQDANLVLDIVELVFRIIQKMDELLNGANHNTRRYPSTEAISDLNTRFKENCIGYKFENDTIIKIDNEFLYSNITKDVMVFLTNLEYQNINEEYMTAHLRFKNDDYKDCIANCAKAFESTMKVICHKRGFSYSQTDTAKTLLDRLYDNKFIPDYLKTQLGGLRSVLGDGISTIRNQTSSHGAGVQGIDVSEELAAYTLNITGSAMKFLLAILEKEI